MGPLIDPRFISSVELSCFLTRVFQEGRRVALIENGALYRFGG